MKAPKPLPVRDLAHNCDPKQFKFKTTAELEDLTEIIGQSRAVEAVHFGIGIRHEGYNLYVMGPPGIGKHTMVGGYLEQVAGSQPQPSDWCYVNNFEQPHKPGALELPHGRGQELCQDMEQFIEELSTTLPATFESEDYREQIKTWKMNSKRSRKRPSPIWPVLPRNNR